jgi:hypothetical protein
MKVFSNDELQKISLILGKKYVGGKLIKHKLFEEWGYSVIFQTSTYTYSEAFAGSGEMAVARLVLEVLAAEQYSLVLLDEPEVSLHPGAQKRLKHFLLEEIRKKKLQVVISSHSPSLIEDLPPQAIQVFSQLPTGKFNVKKEITPDEAFYHLEQTNPAKKTIIVEDLLAKDIITAVLTEMGQAILSLFQVDFYSGGASIIKNHFINVYSHTNDWNKFFVFDGDQKLVPEHFNFDNLIQADQTNDRYRQEIRNQTGIDVPFYPDGNQNQGARTDQEKKLRGNYLKFYLRNVFYLPKKIPEDIIWNQEIAEMILNAFVKTEIVTKLDEEISSKEKFKILSVATTGDTSGIDAHEKMFMQKWVKEHDASYQAIVRIIQKIQNTN